MSHIWVMDDLTAFRLEEEAMDNMPYFNAAQQPNGGFEGAARLDGMAQFQPPEENVKDVPPSPGKGDGSDKQPEKKRRISMEQVRRLETSFNLNNKLKPHQKYRLAKELGLEPRQVVIWFQNRRARIKGKRLESEYYTLKDQYDSLKVDYDYLLMEKERLQNEVSMLSNELKLRNEEKSNSGSMNGSMCSVEGSNILVEPGLPSQEEDPLRGLAPPSIGCDFGFGQLEGDAFDFAFGESLDFVLSGMDEQSAFLCSKLGF